ncbi:hypothetical protein [Nonomuraea sp. NPDC049646]|uniref:hypothetical protein n=1 Tax=unclassified Nonomuraea TaxID=2593643 RepID=UPI0037A09627
MDAKLDVDQVRYQIARWMTKRDLSLREATIQCAATFTRVARDNGHDARLCLLLGETITRIGAEWAAELVALTPR